jgi:hypothetical protein
MWFESESVTGPRVSLYCHLARDAPVGVIFRRGPSKRVLLISWNTRTDTFRIGQWLKGRIYERRCDLSPSGQRLLYFAANYKPPYQTWTAVSRPPFLKALALWPKGDAWGGGGLFRSESDIELNHRDGALTPAEDLLPPRHVRVGPFGDHSGAGEDDPLWSTRLSRDGWRLVQNGSPHERDHAARRWMDFDPPIIWAKGQGSGRGRWELRSVISGLNERGGPWYVVRHELAETESGHRIDLGRSDWADWCHSGDLLFSIGGSLFRLSPTEGARIDDAHLLKDFSDLSFAECEAPEAARSWDRPLPGFDRQAPS